MKAMKNKFVFVLIGLVCLGAVFLSCQKKGEVSKTERPETSSSADFEAIFDGKTLAGWKVIHPFGASRMAALSVNWSATNKSNPTPS